MSVLNKSGISPQYTLVLSSHFLRLEKLLTFRLLITHHFSFRRVLQAHENEQLWRWISLQRELTITDSMARDRQATSVRHPYCRLWVHSIQSSCLGVHNFIFMWVGYPLVIMSTGMYYSAALSRKQSLKSCKCWNDTQFNPLNAPISLLDENISHNVWPGSVLHKLKGAYLKRSAAPTVKNQANLHWYNFE